MQGERIATTLDQGLLRNNPPSFLPKPFPKTRSDYIAQVEVDIRREKRDKHEMTTRWMEILLDIAVTFIRSGRMGRDVATDT